MIAGQGFALTGPEGGEPPGPIRQQIKNVQIVDNVFDSRDISFANQSMVGPSGVLAFPGPNAHMSGITITGNTFLHETGSSDSVGIWANSSGARISDVVVQGNTFDQDANAVELADTKKSPRLSGTRILGNTITRGYHGAANAERKPVERGRGLLGRVPPARQNSCTRPGPGSPECRANVR